MKDVVETTEVFAEPPALPGRWTVCAMLFVATSINYMDRQVLGILKPVLARRGGERGKKKRVEAAE